MKDQVLKKFAELYGGEGDIRTYFAPGRVNLIGEHTDYNGGHVFPCALTMGTYGAARKREDDKLRFYSMNFERAGVIETSLTDLVCKDEAGWTNYPKGVIWAFGKKGYQVPSGMDVVIAGDIPNGSGLSSSASLEVLTGVILRDLFEIEVSQVEIALIGQYSENNFNGMNCGIMDQFASAMGKKDHAIFLNTADLSYEYASVKLDHARIVIANSNVKHSLVGSEYNVRRQQCESALKQLQGVVSIETLGDLDIEAFEVHKNAIKDSVEQRRAKHAVYENQRTLDAVKALKENDIEAFGKLMNASHVSLRDDYEVSCPEMDILAEEAWKLPGVLGSRMTGAALAAVQSALWKMIRWMHLLRQLALLMRNARELRQNSMWWTLDREQGCCRNVGVRPTNML